MNVLVTGSTGFVGTYLIPALIKKGYCVTCLVRDEIKGEQIKKKHNVKIIQGDVTKPKTLEGISEGIDYVIHLAAMGHVSAVTEEAYRMFVDVNEGGTKNLINEFHHSKQLKKFIHFSSTAAMGPAMFPILDENTDPNPKTPYQKSKYRSELIISDAFKAFSFPGLILRPCMIYGPGGYGEFHKFCRLMKKGVFPKVGLKKNLTPLVYVEDVVSAAILALEHGSIGEVYLVASETSISMDKLHQLIMKNIGVNAPYIFVPSCVALIGAKICEVLFPILGKEPIVTSMNIRSTIVDRTFCIKKAKKELGYVPKYSFEKGISQTIKWYKTQGRI